MALLCDGSAAGLLGGVDRPVLFFAAAAAVKLLMRCRFGAQPSSGSGSGAGAAAC